MKVYEVLIEYTSSNLDRLFSYFYEKDDSIQLLSRVIVPFNNKLVCGVVININQVNETKEEYIKKTGFEIKNISSVIDKEPLLNEELAMYRKRNGSISNHSYFVLIKWHYKLYKEIEHQSIICSLFNTYRNIIFGIIKKIKYISKEK